MTDDTTITGDPDAQSETEPERCPVCGDPYLERATFHGGGSHIRDAQRQAEAANDCAIRARGVLTVYVHD